MAGEPGFNQLVEALEETRKSFLKHIEGVTREQAVWKPYVACKSIAETVDHLLWSEKTQLELLQSGQEPDYTLAPSEPPKEPLSVLIADLDSAHRQYVNFIVQTYSNTSIEESVNYWGHQTPLWRSLVYIIAEDGYHTGQCAFIRMASDPTYDYYAHIYG